MLIRSADFWSSKIFKNTTLPRGQHNPSIACRCFTDDPTRSRPYKTYWILRYVMFANVGGLPTSNLLINLLNFVFIYVEKYLRILSIEFTYRTCRILRCFMFADVGGLSTSNLLIKPIGFHVFDLFPRKSMIWVGNPLEM